MKVNRNNYEVWMIDYIDGKLNANEIADLMAFIDANEDIRKEFELFDGETIDKDEITFDKKEGLKKIAVATVDGISETNYEEYFIAYYENDLNEKQGIHLNNFLIANPQLKDEFELHSQLILPIDGNITFKQKNELKKERKIRPIVYWFSGAAAALILLFFAIFNLLVDSAGVPLPQNERFALSFLTPSDPDIVISEDLKTESLRNDFLSNTEQLFVSNSLNTNEDYPTNTFTRQDIARLDSRDVGLKISGKPDISFITTVTSFDTDELYAEANTSEEPEKRKGALGRIIKNFAGRVSNDNGNNEKEKSKTKDPTFVKILDQSITVFNTITGSDNELVKTYSEDGSLSNYRFEGETLGWTSDVSSNGE